MKKLLLKKIGRIALCVNLFTITSLAVNAQVNGEFRTRTVYNASFTSTSGWQVFNSATGWTDSGLTPGTGSIVTIRDGVAMTSNSNGIFIGTLNVGEGNAASFTSTIDGSGTVTGITIVNAGRLSSKPTSSSTVHSGLAIIKSNSDPLTTRATAIITSYTITGTAINFGGSGYTNATTVTFADPAVISGQTASASPLITATGEPIISGGVITGINITNPGSGYTNFPAITITDTGGGTGASFSAQLGVQEVVITAGGLGYTAAPEVIAGSSFQVGGSSSRTVTIENQLNFRAGAKSVSNSSGAPTQNFVLGGDLTVVTPVSFRTWGFWTTDFTGSTHITFNKTGTAASINGGNITFSNLNVGANTTVNSYAAITVLGTTNLNSTGVLPVSLTSFTAKNENNKVRVSWTTSSETNNDRFEVLKSTDGINFTKIASVKAKGPSIYSVDDYYPFNGTNYYKLLQYDLDGKVTDEGVRFANFSFNSNEISSSIYPNPIKSSASVFVKLKQSVGNTKLTLFSTDGKMVHEESINNVGDGAYELKLKRTLNPGMYFLNINTGKSSERLKVIVE
jgi:hypothetical protein